MGQLYQPWEFGTYTECNRKSPRQVKGKWCKGFIHQEVPFGCYMKSWLLGDQNQNFQWDVGVGPEKTWRVGSRHDRDRSARDQAKAVFQETACGWTGGQRAGWVTMVCEPSALEHFPIRVVPIFLGMCFFIINTQCVFAGSAIHLIQYYISLLHYTDKSVTPSSFSEWLILVGCEPVLVYNDPLPIF